MEAAKAYGNAVRRSVSEEKSPVASVLQLNLKKQKREYSQSMNSMLSADVSLAILEGTINVPGEELMRVKRAHSEHVTYSRNVFLPLTRVCRNRCGYCSFRREPQKSGNFMTKADIMPLVALAERHRCHEVLFTLGEGPESYPEASSELSELGYHDIVDYLVDISEMILDRHNVLIHTNAGALGRPQLKKLREVNASMGLMLESSSNRLMETIAHMESPGKEPRLRLGTIEDAGKLRIPFTTGILVGIGETDQEIYGSLRDIRKINDRYGHIQELIVQNFTPGPNTPMHDHTAPGIEKLKRVVCLARLMFPDVSIQVPPNLNSRYLRDLIMLGIDDLGGVSPITPDHVNPECPWPIEALRDLDLVERLPVYPRFIDKEYLSKPIYKRALEMSDINGYVSSGDAIC